MGRLALWVKNKTKKGVMMRVTRHFIFASSIAMLCTLSFGWSISGKVVSATGEGIADVNITTMNYAGFGTKTDATGAFSISDANGPQNPNEQIGTISLNGMKTINASVIFNGNFLSITGIQAQTLKVSLIDALGKVTFNKEFRNESVVSIDMSKYMGRKAAFVRITEGSNSSTYTLTSKGAALMKSGIKADGMFPTTIMAPASSAGTTMAPASSAETTVAPASSASTILLPMFMFSKSGFESLSYNMKAEVETNVVITLTASGAQPKSSSSGWNNPFGQRSSSSEKANPASSSEKANASSSSAKVEAAVDCSGKTYQAGDHKMSVNVDGKNRTFIMHVPNTYKGDKAVPLVVDYHPIGGSGQGQLSGTTYKKLTDQEGVISLYPDGTGKPGGMGNGWNVGPCCSNDDDIAFSREMIKQVEEKVCIDTKRVYATGFSMGGGMSNHVACNMADIYAAVAPAAMDLNTTNSAKCNPPRPISIIMFRGTADFVCRYEGGDSGFNDGLNFLGAEKNFKFWADKNGCTGSPTTNSNGCQEYSSCKDGTKVVLCTKQGGSHEQGDGNIGWPFLKSFTLP